MTISHIRLTIEIDTLGKSNEEIDELIKSVRKNLKENYKIQYVHLQYDDYIQHAKPAVGIEAIPLNDS